MPDFLGFLEARIIIRVNIPSPGGDYPWFTPEALKSEGRASVTLKRKDLASLGLFIFLLSIPIATIGQIIENPSKPKAVNSGSAVAPEEVLTITDEGTSDFYFKWPYSLRTGPDGSLVFRDREQILHFDGGGKFLANLFKKGQGPGEMQYPGDCLFVGDRVVVYSGNENKLVFFDRNGKFEKELSVPSQDNSLILLHHQPGVFYFKATEFPRTSGDPKIVETPQTIVALGESDGALRTLSSFAAKVYVVTSGGGGGAITIASLITTSFKNNFLVLTHTEEYLIKLYDLAANRVVREFRRAYDRVKSEPLTDEQKKGYININGKFYFPPEQKYQNDIKNVLTRDDLIWVVTSTKDKAKGVLLDIFDENGIYRDRFWLKLPEPALASILTPGRCALDGDFLWVVEQTEDETFLVKKFRVPRAL